VSFAEGTQASRTVLQAKGGRLRADWLGCVGYAEALELQYKAIDEVRTGGEDRLLLLEHPPVVTLGRSSSRVNLLEDEEALGRRGVEVVEVSRGGDVTYHGRGQLVGYFISNLRSRGAPDVHRYLRDLESALIEAVGTFGVEAIGVEGRTGVFVETPAGEPVRKLASIGVGVRHWVSYHGFGLNVDIDLAEFDAIVPCGLDDVEMTSLVREGVESTATLGSRVRDAIADAFEKRFAVVAS
jgi:lipoyl(octanoyl) transferase